MKNKMKITLNAPVVLSFTFACLIVTVLGVITNGLITKALFVSYRSGLFNPLTYVRLFTHVLGHSGFDHFIGNAAYLLLLGPMLEEKYSSKKIMMIIIITAVATALVNTILFKNLGICGASGVVFAFILLTSFTSFRQGEIPLSFVLVAVIYIGQQIWQGVFSNDNISNLSHIVGGIVGSVAGYNLNRRR